MSARAPCPTCRKQVAREANPTWPFCCERCRLVDLGKWFGEEYRVAGDAEASGLGPRASVGDDPEA